MTTKEITLMEVFFAAFCNTNGSVPKCAGCEHYEYRPNHSTACTHPENPNNLIADPLDVAEEG